MCQHNLPCSIVLPTACFPEGPSPHFTFCSFWRRRPRLEAVLSVPMITIAGHVYREFCLCSSSRWLLSHDRHGSGSIDMLLHWKDTSRMLI